MSLFDFTTEEAQEAVNVKQGFVPAKPGINFFELKDVQIKDDSNDLVFQFKGTRAEELGSFSHWVNSSTFDPKDERFDEKKAGWVRNQIVHIVKAFLTDEEMKPITGVAHSGYLSFVQSIARALTPDKFNGVESKIKLLINYADKKDKNDNYKTNLPLFPKFISTDLRPFALAVNDKVNPNSGEPFERIAPLSDLSSYLKEY